MDPQLWKINIQPVSEFARDLQLSLVNQAPDRLTFNADGQLFDSAALFNYGDSLSLYKGTDRWFAGVVLSGPRYGSPSMESHDYQVAGLWWYLEQLVFEQEWRAGPGTLNKGHVLLGRDIDNDTISVGAVIKEVLDHAIAAGAPFAYVQADLDALTAVPPTDEQTDLACSEAVSKMLRWIPDIATWFDYAPATPVLRFTRRAAASAVQYNCTAGKPAEQIEISRRDDLVQSGVIINYESLNEDMLPSLDIDVYPEGTTPGLDTASFTINIPGGNVTTQELEVEVEVLPVATLIQRLVPHVAGAVLLSAGEVTVLKSGSLPSWTGASTWETEVSATAEYTDEIGDHVKEKVSAVVVETSAETKTYSRIVSFTPGDPIPIGLAQALYEAISQIHFQGRFNTLESECTGGVRPGMVLNLTGGLAEWATMRAAVQQVAFDLDAGRTSITFGPPEHLSPQDHIALLNANRRRITHYSGDSRATGLASSGGDIATGGGGANSSGSSALRLSKLILKDYDGNKVITIDTAQIAKGKVLVGTDDNNMAVEHLKWR